MAKKEKKSKRRYSDEEIVRNFWQGFTIKMLTEAVAKREEIRRAEAKKLVELALYNEEMRQSRKRRQVQESGQDESGKQQSGALCNGTAGL